MDGAAGASVAASADRPRRERAAPMVVDFLIRAAAGLALAAAVGLAGVPSAAARPPRGPLQRGAPLVAVVTTARRSRLPVASCVRMAGGRCEGAVAVAAARPPPSPAATCRSATGIRASRRRSADRPPAPRARSGGASCSGTTPCDACRDEAVSARPGPKRLIFRDRGRICGANLEGRPFAGAPGVRRDEGVAFGWRCAAPSRRRNRSTLSDTSDRPAAPAAEDDHTNTPREARAGRIRAGRRRRPPPPEAEAAAEAATDADADATGRCADLGEDPEFDIAGGDDATRKRIPPPPRVTFGDLGLSELIVLAVADAGYVTPTPIQEQAIPVVLMGRDCSAAPRPAPARPPASPCR